LAGADQERLPGARPGETEDSTRGAKSKRRGGDRVDSGLSLTWRDRLRSGNGWERLGVAVWLQPCRSNGQASRQHALITRVGGDGAHPVAVPT
jgi:hypothetical protein